MLASVLPELINQMTPQGQVPQGNALDGVLGSLLGELGGRWRPARGGRAGPGGPAAPARIG